MFCQTGSRVASHYGIGIAGGKQKGISKRWLIPVVEPLDGCAAYVLLPNLDTETRDFLEKLSESCTNYRKDCEMTKWQGSPQEGVYRFNGVRTTSGAKIVKRENCRRRPAQAVLP